MHTIDEEESCYMAPKTANNIGDKGFSALKKNVGSEKNPDIIVSSVSAYLFHRIFIVSVQLSLSNLH